jgi:ROK family
VAKYQVPVWVSNATQMTTLGELRTGSGRDVRDMLFVDLGKEITAGIVCDGRVYRGAQGGAGLIGHIATTEDSTVLCMQDRLTAALVFRRDENSSASTSVGRGFTCRGSNNPTWDAKASRAVPSGRGTS